MLAHDTKECMFFVGGDDYKVNNDAAGVALAGGCSKAWWDNQVGNLNVGDENYADNVEVAMSMLMQSDGSPICSVPVCNVTQGGGNLVRINDTSAGNMFSEAEVGMLTYYSDPGFYMYGAGVYEIVAVDPSGNWIEVNEEWGIDPPGSGVAYVGGGWSDLKTLAENFVDSSKFTQEIWVNKNISLTSFMNLGNYHSGSKSLNTFGVLKGFNRIPGDITDPEGAHYQSIMDVYLNGANATSFVEIDFTGIGGDYSIFIEYGTNIIMSGFRIANGVGYSLRSLNTSDGVKLIHNVFADCAKLPYIRYAHSCLLYDCCFDAPGNFTIDTCDGINIINSIIKSSTAQGLLYQNSIGTVVSCIVLGDTTALSCYVDSRVMALSNTMYSIHSGFGVLTTANNATSPAPTLDAINNILEVPSDQPIYNHLGGGYGYGTLLTIGNCAFASDGSPLTEVAGNNSGNSSVQDGFHTPGQLVDVDPLLDARYRSHNKNVLLGGITGVGGQKTTIGAVSQSHQFAGRSGNANPGRFGIIR